MKRLIIIFQFLTAYICSYSQGYNVDIDTFYVQTPEYTNTLGIDSLYFPCTITTPNFGSDFPILILVHGTSSLDKDANSSKDYLDSLGANYRKAQTRIFYEIADSLSNNGIIVLRYDKRSFTVNCIEKPSCWYVDTISPYDYIKDIHSAVEFAKTIPNGDTCNIFLAGHSQGGSFVSQVGYQRSDIRGVLNMAGTAQPIDSVSIYQTEFVDGDIIGANILRSQFDSLRSGTWSMTDTLYKNHFSPRFWLDWISHTDSAVIVQKQSDKPTALMYCTLDKFVPANTHFQIWQDSVIRPNVTFQVFNNLDHSYGTEFDSIMSPAVLTFMTNWIHNTVLNCSTTFIGRHHQDLNFSVFPIPTSDRLFIKSNDVNSLRYEILDLSGMLIFRGIYDTSGVNLSSLPSGAYIIRIINSTSITNKRILKQ